MQKLKHNEDKSDRTQVYNNLIDFSLNNSALCGLLRYPGQDCFKLVRSEFNNIADRSTYKLPRRDFAMLCSF